MPAADLSRHPWHRRSAFPRRWANAEREELWKALDYLRPGDTLVVPSLDRLGRSLQDLISIVAADTGWVRNVRAAGGKAALRRQGRKAPILLEAVPSADRAEILRRYLADAPGARPHLGLGPAAPLSEFRRIAPRHPPLPRPRPLAWPRVLSGRTAGPSPPARRRHRRPSARRSCPFGGAGSRRRRR
ncbi:recombinase family protein [Nonomuraea sp. G32]|nr:recombinase family protein [Nonomuraea sp. G32]MDP4504903.1 recombinase family protein [Nonomuraea sp. G32]